MKPTVESGQWRQAHGTEQPLELILSQLRSAANRVFQKRTTLATAGGGAGQILWQDQDELPQNSHATLTVLVQASNADGTVWGKWEQTALFLRPPTGAGVLLGAVQDRHPAIGAGGLTVTTSISGSRMQVAFNDNGATVDVDVWIEARIA